VAHKRGCITRSPEESLLIPVNSSEGVECSDKCNNDDDDCGGVSDAVVVDDVDVDINDADEIDDDDYDDDDNDDEGLINHELMAFVISTITSNERRCCVRVVSLQFGWLWSS
jgi:hypothetical protein